MVDLASKLLRQLSVNSLREWVKTNLICNRTRIGSYEVNWSVSKVKDSNSNIQTTTSITDFRKLHIGPGSGWKKSGEEWCTLDVDPALGDVVIDLNDFDSLPFPDDSIECIYGSHVFEHVNPWSSQRLFQECYRVLVSGGYFRLVLPDVRRSIEEYIQGNSEYLLFQRRMETARRNWKLDDLTLFECLRGDFVSRSLQPKLGPRALAHQNAWDFETIARDLCRAGFRDEDVHRMEFQKTMCPDFTFEGTYPSEANESYRSLYVEAIKKIESILGDR